LENPAVFKDYLNGNLKNPPSIGGMTKGITRITNSAYSSEWIGETGMECIFYALNLINNIMWGYNKDCPIPPPIANIS
jgi:hypothetical protein